MARVNVQYPPPLPLPPVLCDSPLESVLLAGDGSGRRHGRVVQRRESVARNCSGRLEGAGEEEIFVEVENGIVVSEAGIWGKLAVEKT